MRHITPPIYHGDRTSVKRPPQRFSALPTLFGAEVIDHDGREVHREPSIEMARLTAEMLNEAAHAGSGTLADAMAGLR